MSGHATRAAEGLRLALVCPYSLSWPGGVQAQVLGLAGAYRARGHAVSVLAPVDDVEPEIPDGVELVTTGRSRGVSANGSVAPVSLSVGAVRRGVREVRSWEPDVLHVHEPFAPGVPLGVAMARGLPPEVATFHRSGASRGYRSLRPLLQPLGRRLAARCAVSPAARATAEAVVDGEIEIVFNGVECERFANVDPWPALRPAVLFLGRHEARKGLAVLLDAFDRLRLQTPGLAPELWVAGEGPGTEALRHTWPPDDDIRWLGVIPEDEKARRLAAAAVLCAPSLGQESFGLVLLEAMAARAVVVASDIDGYRDAAGPDAVFVAAGRSGELADALAGVLEGRIAVVPANGNAAAGTPVHDGRALWLDRAEARAATFSMTRLVARYEAIFDRVLEGEPGSPRKLPA